MPGGDRTGPAGQGPRTGRGLGYCSGYDVSGYENPATPVNRGAGRGAGMGVGSGAGRGVGRGAGRGRGRGRR